MAATHRVNSNERAMKDLARVLAVLRRLGVFNRDTRITTNDMRRCMVNWKKAVFGVK